ncbi:MAG TPA: hypothetical protein VMH87_00830, partial [Pseudomonadales bacterium]|nr:hypothetical protein [Pseudomonadales bacterium]
AIAVIALNGGGIKFGVKPWGINLNVSTDGLIKLINKWLSDRKNRQLAESVRKKLDALKVDSPADIVKLIDHINKHKP